MHRLLLLLLIGWLPGSLSLLGQADSLPPSALGLHLTPHGHLHVLVIVVRYDDTQKMWNSRWPDSSEPGMLPEIFRGEHNEMFCQTPEAAASGAYHNLSDFYWRMSQGKFLVTGEVYPVQVPVSFQAETNRNFFSRQQAMNQAAIDWIAQHDSTFDWSRFDRRSNETGYGIDDSRSAPDSILDYVYIIHRARGSNGVSSTGSLRVPGTPYRIREGQTVAKAQAEAEHNWTIFVHELAHHIYGAPHLMGANRTDGDYYLTQMGWGMMADWIGPFFLANAWERWWLGWQEVQTVTQAGTYLLGDLMTVNEAIRIPIPGSKQYLWLENHQKRDPWDQKLFYRSQEGDYQYLTPSAPGLYAYVVGEYGRDRSQPRLSPFNREHANMIRTYNGQGNFDWTLLEERIPEGKGARWRAFRRGASNPIMGLDDFSKPRFDYDGDGRIGVGHWHGNRDGGQQEEDAFWVEEIDGELRLLGHQTGDEHDALGVGDELSLSGVFPVLNRPHYDHQAQQYEPISLNGLHIEVVRQYPVGDFLLKVSFDDWSLRRDQRWCGPLRLDSTTGQEPLRIAERVTLTLDLSGTNDRLTPDSTTGTFINPSYWIIADGREVVLAPKARLYVQRQSTLRLQNNARLRLERKSTLRIDGSSTLELAGQSRLVLTKGARLILERGATLGEDSLARIELRGGKLVDKR